jgi:hypothetical protein
VTGEHERGECACAQCPVHEVPRCNCGCKMARCTSCGSASWPEHKLGCQCAVAGAYRAIQWEKDRAQSFREEH